MARPAARVAFSHMVLGFKHRRIAELCRNTRLRSMYLTLIDFLEHSVDHAESTRFDGDSMVAVHRDLVKARGAV